MLRFSFQVTDNPNNIGLNQRVDFADLVSVGGVLVIEIDKEVFFRAGIAILEFVLVIDKWIENGCKNPMLYNSVETEDNPLISFIPNGDKWNISSPWQSFSSKVLFTKEELLYVIYDLKLQVEHELQKK